MRRAGEKKCKSCCNFIHIVIRFISPSLLVRCIDWIDFFFALLAVLFLFPGFFSGDGYLHNVCEYFLIFPSYRERECERYRVLSSHTLLVLVQSLTAGAAEERRGGEKKEGEGGSRSQGETKVSSSI
jgi:hypothetical protein